MVQQQHPPPPVRALRQRRAHPPCNILQGLRGRLLMARRKPDPPTTQDRLTGLGKLIEHRRRELGLSMSALAKQAGVSERALWDLQSARRPPRLDTLLPVLDALGLQLSAAATPTPGRTVRLVHPGLAKPGELMASVMTAICHQLKLELPPITPTAPRRKKGPKA